MEKTFVSNSAEETMELGKKIAKAASNGSTFCFTGDLGAGKTTLVRGIAQALNIKSVVQSPTFNIMKIYFDGSKPLIHIDAYRLADVDTDIGLDEYIGYETGLTVIEWPDFIKNLIPSNAITINITNLGDTKRQITIQTEDTSLLEDLN
ncbi:MAG: tRNA (adenosine(37)-N6)-threonylcarbamoyltransferase complex ATPase subunit type 1 TsaE [Bacilli bacterium]|nr:tRNA (adenosine(37)-N6)-threonylcarbamoyltransferase complex ATPase subunit type 1 TsaE [Bacilli bacterium]